MSVSRITTEPRRALRWAEVILSAVVWVGVMLAFHYPSALEGSGSRRGTRPGVGSPHRSAPGRSVIGEATKLAAPRLG
jgi:hypothetical protein